MSVLYDRKISLIVGTGSTALELTPPGSNLLSVRFSVKQWDLQTPGSARITVRNLSDRTANLIEKEFTRVVLQAGYQNGPYGVIFQGTIVQVRRGRESAADTYVDIIAADGDEAINFAVVNTTLAAGSTFKTRVAAIAKAMGVYGITLGSVPDIPQADIAAIRGKVMYGMASDHLRDESFSTDTKWFIRHGQLNLVPLTGYLPGEAAVLNSLNGMIGLPEQTQEGISVRSLLRPDFQPGARVQIDNKSIQQVPIDIGLGGVTTNAFLPSIADDGLYRIIVCEHEGDTRGQPWYSNLICIDQNSNLTPGLLNKGYQIPRGYS